MRQRHRLVAKAPFGRLRLGRFLAALRCDGLTVTLRHRRTDQWHELPRQGRSGLVPILKPGDIVVMDNLGRREGPRQTPRDPRGQKPKLFILPAYSPDLHSIDQAFAGKLKTVRRMADAFEQSTKPGEPIGARLDCFTPTECAKYFSNVGMLQPDLVLVLVCTKTEGRDERDPKTGGDPLLGCGRL